MSIMLIAPIISVIALSVAVAGWDAAVFARRHFEQPRERVITWVRECGDALELLALSGCETLKEQEEPPVPYRLRAYLLFQLVSDLDELESFAKTPHAGWPFDYVEQTLVEQVKSAVAQAMRCWRTLRRPSVDGGDHMPEGADEIVRRGLQRIGNLQEQILNYERMPWILTVLKRRDILRGVRRRQVRRHEEWVNRKDRTTSLDLVVPL